MSTKMDSSRITREMELILSRLRAGLIDTGQARQELGVMVALSRAYEVEELEERLRRIEGILEERHE